MTEKYGIIDMCEYEIWDFQTIEQAAILTNDNSFHWLWDFCLQEFTPRQIAILLALEQGKTQAQIARDWDVSDEAVRQQLEIIRNKLAPHLKKRGLLNDE